MKINDKKQKLSYITYLQSYALMLVIIGHCLPKVNLGDEYPYWAEILHKFVYSFHMPLFFVLSGFLLANSFYKNSESITSFKNFLLTKTKRLLVPYFAIGTTAYLLKVFIFNKFAYRPAKFEFAYYVKSMIIPWDNPNMYLWFLPTMFIVLILGYPILRKYSLKNVDTKLLLFISFLISLFSKYTDISILNISGVLYYFFFFMTGIVFFLKKDCLFSYMRKYGFIACLLFIFSFYFKSAFGWLNLLNTYAASLCGIFLSFSLSLLCDKHRFKFLFGLLDNRYYQIYLLSWFFQTGARIFYQIHIVNYPTVCFLMFAASIIFPLLITDIIERYIPKLKIFIGLA